MNFIIFNLKSTVYEFISSKSSEIKFSNGVFLNISIAFKNPIMQIINTKIIVDSVLIKEINTDFIFSSKSELNILNTKFMIENESGFSAIISNNNKYFYVNGSIFSNFCNDDAGPIKNIKTPLQINFSIFYNSNANNGGALYTENSNASIFFNSFIGSSAQYGGSIYFNSSLNLEIILENNYFNNGYAVIAGGAFYSVYSIPKLSNNSFYNNSAAFGNNYASPPIVLLLEISSKLREEINKYLPSSFFSDPFVLSLKDIYNNSIKWNYSGKAFLELANPEIYQNLEIFDFSRSNNLINGQTFSDLISETFIFENIHINLKQKSTILIKISSDLIKPFSKGSYEYSFPHYMDSNNNYFYLLKIISKECPIGKKNNKNKINFILGYIFTNSTNFCQKCPTGEYSLNTNDTYCRRCPPNAQCTTNGSFLNVLPGYWRSNYFSTSILECFMPNACLGNECNEGYEGPLCDTCKANYFKSFNYDCIKCKSAIVSYILMALVLIFYIYNYFD